MAINNYIKKLLIEVSSKKDKYAGSVDFDNGLNIIHAENGFGKSLIYSGLGWTLGLERMTVDGDGDINYFSHGVRENIEIDGNKEIKIETSRTSIELSLDGTQVEMSRLITPKEEAKAIEIVDRGDKGLTGKYRLGKNTLGNENIGYQSIFFKLFGWQPTKCRSYSGKDSYIYLENLGCLFFIDQKGGWNDIQSQQIRKYGILDIECYATEYILGLDKHIKNRYKEQSEESGKRDFKEEVQLVYDKINKITSKHGSLDFLSSQSSHFNKLWLYVKEFNVKSYLEEKIGFKFDSELKSMMMGLKLIEEQLVADGNKNKTDAYQEKLNELIFHRENLNAIETEISKITFNHTQDQVILSKLSSKLRSASDLLLLKTDSLGIKSKHHSCPTCRQDIDPEANSIGNLSAHQVKAFIVSTTSEKKLLESSIERSEKELAVLIQRRNKTLTLIEKLKRSLDIQKLLTEESKAKLINLLEKRSEFELKIDELKKLNKSTEEINSDFKTIVEKYKDFFEQSEKALDLKSEKKIIKQFEKKFKELLKNLDLSIFKIDKQNIDKIKFDDSYRPLYEGKELKNLGSASDQARIIFPYILALMDTALKNGGNHPGFVVFDEPIQQNPDEKRRPALIDFIADIPKTIEGQVIILTYLLETERQALTDKKIKFKFLEGQRFLKAIK